MRRLFDFIGMTAGGYLGWMVGAWVSFFTAFLVGMVGTGVGLYVTRRLVRGWLP